MTKRLLILIITGGFLLRVVALGSLPPSLNWDEVSHGYNAYSLLKSGLDEWGELPLANFRAYGDYPLTLNLYLTVPFVAVFGLSEFAIRLPHALLGTGVIILAYFLAMAVTKNKWAALTTSFFVAIDPWLLFPSRFVLQSNVAVFFFLLGTTAYFYRAKNTKYYYIALLSWGLTLYSYHSTRIFTPMFVVGLGVLHYKSVIETFRKRTNRFWRVAIVVAVFAPLPFIFLNPSARARSNEVFLVNEGAVQSIIAKRQSSALPPIVVKALYNRPTYLLTHSLKNYVEYFSPTFLFIKGGTQYQFSIPNRGLMSTVALPFFYIGLVVLTYRALKGNKTYQILLLWLLLAPIPASITTERFAVLRASAMLPLPQLLSAIGIVTFIHYTKRTRYVGYATAFVILAGSLFGLESYLTQYATSYSRNYSWAWQYGYKDASTYIKDHYNDYDSVIMTKRYGEPHEFLLFYLKWDPSQYRSDPNLVRFYQSNWYWVDRFDKFYFVNDWQIPEKGTEFVLESKGTVSCENRKCLLFTSPDHVPSGWSYKESIRFLDGKEAFVIYEHIS